MTETTASKATELLRLHQAPEILQVVNVWDAISAKVIGDVPGTQALPRPATPSPPHWATRTARTSRSMR